MNSVRLALVAALWLGLVALTGAQDDKKAEEAKLQKQLLGRWEVEKGKGLPSGAIVEFKKDGKMAINFTKDGEEQKVEATYKVKGKAFVMTMKRGDKERTQTIKVTKITDKVLELEGEKGDALTFKRAAKKKKDD
jgi:uncharacterized protein (TIGR03066 family)